LSSHSSRPFAAWIPAEAAGLSGVLAVVTAGIYAERRVQPMISSTTRLRGAVVWDAMTFALEGLLFLLVGLQLPRIVGALSPRPLGSVLWYAAVVGLATILVRIGWSFGARWLTQMVARALRLRAEPPRWRIVAVVSWAGLRGGDSLAAALAVPLLTATGAAFPDRDLIVFLTFCVILVTLVGQGLTLPMLIGLLGVRDEGEFQREEAHARGRMAEAGRERLEILATEPWAPRQAVQQLRARYEHWARHGTDQGEDADRQRHAGERRLRREVLAAERQEALRLNNQGVINHEVLQQIQRDLDLEDVRLGPED
jgi:monovalent cation/hydrogen antiporter